MSKDLDITYHTGKTEIHVTSGDLTEVKADVLVSSDDVYLSRRDGISRALSNKAGIALDNDIRKLRIPLELGGVAVTNAGRLPAQYLFHATTMDFATEPPMNDLVAHLTRCIMDIGDALNVEHIAMPLLGTGTAGFSPARGVSCIFQTAAYHANSNKYFGVKKISIVVFGSPRIQTVVRDIKKKIIAAEAVQDRIHRYQHIIKETENDDELADILTARIRMSRKTLQDIFFFKGIESSDDFGKKDALLTYEGYQEAKRRLQQSQEKLAAQISSKQKIIEIHQNRREILLQKKAHKGIDVAPETITEIEDIEEQLEAAKYELKQMNDQQAVYQQEFDSLQYQQH